MSDFAAFVYAVASHWVALMSGLFSLGLALHERYKECPSEWLFWSVAVISLILVFFLAWKDQFKRAEDLQAKLNASSGEALETKVNQLETELKEARERLKRQKMGEWEPLSEDEKKELETLLSQFTVPQVIGHYYDQRGKKLARDFAEVFSKVGWPQPILPKPDRAINMIRIYAQPDYPPAAALLGFIENRLAYTATWAIPEAGVSPEPSEGITLTIGMSPPR